MAIFYGNMWSSRHQGGWIPRDKRKTLSGKHKKQLPRWSSSYSFFSFKLLKFWAQSFLIGVPKVICGFRDDDGVLSHLETFKTLEIPRKVRHGTGAWVGFYIYHQLQEQVLRTAIGCFSMHEFCKRVPGLAQKSCDRRWSHSYLFDHVECALERDSGITCWPCQCVPYTEIPWWRDKSWYWWT